MFSGFFYTVGYT